MKRYLLCAMVAGLVGCNMGDNANNSNDVQTSSVTNGTANINVTATGCRTITTNNTCTLSVKYSAPANSGAINAQLDVGGLNNYNISNTNNCKFSTTTQTCNVTITSLGSTSNAQTANVYPNGFQNTQTSFIVGGGM